MSCLPRHGRVSCTRCHSDIAPQFDVSKRTEGDWRITANPLSWGSIKPEVVVLGFSKGPTQAEALASTPHDELHTKAAAAMSARFWPMSGSSPPTHSIG